MLRMHLSEKIIIPLSVMFRFFPTVMDEAASINAAMKMRGIHIGGKNAGKMLEYRLVPLMTCCVKIGEELSAAALTLSLIHICGAFDHGLAHGAVHCSAGTGSCAYFDSGQKGPDKSGKPQL